MIQNFVYWIIGIVEDFPIPYEIKKIYFCLHKESNNYSYISFGGNEFDCQNRLINFQYYPPDAQFFNTDIFKKNFSLLDLRLLLTKASQNNFLKNEFLGKNVFYGIFGESKIYKLD